MMEMKKCPYCNAENADQAEVCVKCYAAIPQNLSENTKKNSESDRETRNKKRSDT